MRVRAYAILFIFVYFVQVYDGKTTVHLYAITILTYVIPTDIHLTCQADFDTYSIMCDLILIYFEFVLFS